MYDSREFGFSSVGSLCSLTCSSLRFFEIINALGQEIIILISLALWPLPLYELAISWVWRIKISALEWELVGVLSAEENACRLSYRWTQRFTLKTMISLRSFEFCPLVDWQIHIIPCMGLCVTYRRVLDWMIGFIDTLYTQLGTTGNYSAIADPHTLQFTVTHTLGFSVFTSRILVTDL
jgi:hypothetical protein